MTIKVGPDGFVRIVDVMGDDAAIVQAARISYGVGTKTPSDDRTLIRYLMRHRHTTPFEMVTFKYHIRCPMDVWRQWVRHRTASINEYSTRYSEAIDASVATPPEAWRRQSDKNRQGSGDFLPLDVGTQLSTTEAAFLSDARLVYQSRLAAGVAREQARKDLPLSTYTEAYWQMNLHNLFHFLALRLDEHAQLEIREFAQAVAEIVRAHVPLAYEAFWDYVVEAVTFSGIEYPILAQVLTAAGVDWDLIGWVATDKLGNKREQQEFAGKLQRLAELARDAKQASPVSKDTP